MKEKRQKVWAKIPPHVKVCAVTKGRTIQEVQNLLNDLPDIQIIGENRWPDCEEKFKHFQNLERHFIGPLQSNKINKVLPITDVIQSIDSIELLKKISARTTKTIKFTFQVNISKDSAKQGIDEDNLRPAIEEALKAPNVELIGLMTIGTKENQEKYFSDFKNLFDEINAEYFKMPILSMGMSDDFETAIKCGATMVRLGSCLFE